MEIIPIDLKNKAEFFQYIHHDVITYFSFIHELQFNFQKTRFWIAKKETKIAGCMFHTGISARMLGTDEAVEIFFKFLKDFPKFISLSASAHKIATKYIKSQAKTFKMHRLFMRKTKLKQINKHNVTILQKKNLAAGLEVFRVVEPENWNNQSLKDLKYDSENIWYGIEKDGLFVSICWNQIFNHGGHIAFVATRPEYQNQGMATELITFALTQNFKKNTLSIIHVSAENSPAYDLYQKLGYSTAFTLSIYINPISQLDKN